jgi:hypothetical protein
MYTHRRRRSQGGFSAGPEIENRRGIQLTIWPQRSFLGRFRALRLVSESPIAWSLFVAGDAGNEADDGGDQREGDEEVLEGEAFAVVVNGPTFVGQIADATAGEQEGGEDAELGGEVVGHGEIVPELKISLAGVGKANPSAMRGVRARWEFNEYLANSRSAAPRKTRRRVAAKRCEMNELAVGVRSVNRPNHPRLNMGVDGGGQVGDLGGGGGDLIEALGDDGGALAFEFSG